jgi:hypothetical protein
MLHITKYYWIFFAQGEPEQPQERHYWAFEVNDDVFGLKSLVPVTL